MSIDVEWSGIVEKEELGTGTIMEPRKLIWGGTSATARCAPTNNATRIEADFVRGGLQPRIATDYGLSDRASVYRHAHALNLFEKRKRNIKAALEQSSRRLERLRSQQVR